VVREYVLVEKVEFKGINEIPIATLKPSLRLSAGEPLNPYHLKQDREYIREQYLQKGYHFSSVEETTKQGTTGIILTWNVVEGPLVSVEAIVFTGNITVDEGELRRFLLSKQNEYLFGAILTSRNPFIERNLREDVDRVKLFYRLEGWLDIQHGNNVFLEDVEFSEDKTLVGWTAGAGIEYGFTQNWSAKLEYLYMDLGSRTYSITGVDNGLHSSFLRLGVNYHF